MEGRVGDSSEPEKRGNMENAMERKRPKALRGAPESTEQPGYTTTNGMYRTQ
jgi:hypothetical protein